MAHYDLLGPIGEGGMGVLYKARDRRLDRTVALKLLRPDVVTNDDRRRRFVQEAKAASALNHPNIVTVYDVGETDGPGESYIAMEYVPGVTLSDRLAGGPLPLPEALHLGAQVASALAAAHAAGIVHRDVKPGNILVTPDGHAKVCDFGLAKLGVSSVAETLARAAEASGTEAMTPPLTRAGLVLGTPAYMSPEQAEGHHVDARSDVFSLGATLYEMLTARRPFRGDTGAALISSILRDHPPPLRSVRGDVPREVAAVIEKSLAKDPAGRFADAGPVRDALLAAEAALHARPALPRWALPSLVALLVVGAAAGAWAWRRAARQRWARETLLPQVERLSDDFRTVAAYRAALQAREILGNDARLDATLKDVAFPGTIEVEPPGAEVLALDYSDPDGSWLSLGQAPLRDHPIPAGQLRLRIRKEGYEAIDVATDWEEEVLRYRLFRPGESPAGMVWVSGGPYRKGTTAVELDDYWLDKYEVTNGEFKAFVDAGGYARPELWKHPFVKDGRTLAFGEAMRELKDATGRPGPSTWELGAPLAGREDHPVGGVSWYEAAAYAEFAGKSLPTLFHWFRGAGLGIFSEVLLFSNFGGQGPSRRSEQRGVSPWGAFDMAGNIREWASTPYGDRRYVLGGSWNDPTYMFTQEDAL
ncbi:MAG TPA: bifunctional serine/threonine-protein kinase/formylglycine-generating enzyme family protein, partial [Vicinamibacteria bacterium]|nr:bifunctional serine/threonine-protein kinase/formylglycine-generating enzyme family protein [Vicinamibacteria bacterium]